MDFRFIFVLLIALSAYVNAEKIPVDALSKLPEQSNPVISPDGKQLAVEMTRNGKNHVVLLDLPTTEQPGFHNLMAIPLGNLIVHDYVWANNDVLIIKLGATVTWYFQLLNVTRLALVSRKTGKLDFLEADPNEYGVPRQHSQIVSLLKHDNDHILAVLDDDKDSSYIAPEVDIVNIYSGKKRRVQPNIRGIYRWLADNDGKIRIGIAHRDVQSAKYNTTIYHRRTESDSWEILQEATRWNKKQMVPVSFDEHDPNILLLAPDETTADSDYEEPKLYRYDLTEKKVLGEHFDPKVENIKKLMKEFAEDRRVALVSHDDSKTRFVFKFHSDVSSPRYLLVDTKTEDVIVIGDAYQDLVGLTFSPMKRVSYKARDGLKIPAYLTIPHSSEGKNLPTVIFPHGGPHSRDHWGFNTWVQFFADRGYAVLQPQFRGSSGFGEEFEKKGYEQWGLKMQDDVIDGVKWMIEQGIADPDRICIVGASYGGYVSSMALASTPEFFKCGVAIAGVHDLKKLIDDQRNYYFSGINRAVLNKSKDAKTVSPYHLADNIKAPLLLIHGSKDSVVDIDHSKNLYKKLKKRKADVEFVAIKDAEHWTVDEAHELIIMKNIEAFLAKHLDKPLKVATSTPQ